MLSPQSEPRCSTPRPARAQDRRESESESEPVDAPGENVTRECATARRDHARCLGRIAMMDGVAVEAPRCLGGIAMMDGVAAEAPRYLGGIAMMDGVAVEAPRDHSPPG